MLISFFKNAIIFHDVCETMITKILHIRFN